MGRFASELARLRRESGFPTPYAFPFTFAYHLKVERGGRARRLMAF